MHTIRKDTYFVVSGVIFLAVGVLHGLRALNELPVTIGSFTIPVYWSWVAFVIAFFLSYSAFHLKK